jgi:hypothetical protein
MSSTVFIFTQGDWITSPFGKSTTPPSDLTGDLLKADALIAATAWAKDLILVTGNVSDFSFIEEIHILSPGNLIKQGSSSTEWL